MKLKGIIAAAGAVVTVLAFEPTTIAAKLAYALFGAAAGSVAADGFQPELESLRRQITMPSVHPF